MNWLTLTYDYGGLVLWVDITIEGRLAISRTQVITGVLLTASKVVTMSRWEVGWIHAETKSIRKTSKKKQGA